MIPKWIRDIAEARDAAEALADGMAGTRFNKVDAILTQRDIAYSYNFALQKIAEGIREYEGELIALQDKYELESNKWFERAWKPGNKNINDDKEHSRHIKGKMYGVLDAREKLPTEAELTELMKGGE